MSAEKGVPLDVIAMILFFGTLIAAIIGLVCWLERNDGGCWHFGARQYVHRPIDLEDEREDAPTRRWIYCTECEEWR